MMDYFEMMDKFRKKLEWKTIDRFIEEFDYLEGCEAIIKPDGQIAYAIQSHIEALIGFTGESSKEIYDKMDILETPIRWLVEYTSCISVWPYGICSPIQITKEQKKTLTRLISEGYTQPTEYFS